MCISNLMFTHIHIHISSPFCFQGKSPFTQPLFSVALRCQGTKPGALMEISQVIHDGPGRGHRRGGLPGLDDAGAAGLHLLPKELVEAVSCWMLGGFCWVQGRKLRIFWITLENYG